MQKLLIVGKTSFLASRFLSHCEDNSSISAVRRFDDIKSILEPDSVVINFGIHPSYITEPYSEKNDVDLTIAKEISKSNIHQIMISTRQVYSQKNAIGITEDFMLDPVTQYGKNKLTTELKLQEIL